MIMIFFKIAILLIALFLLGAFVGAFIRRNFNFEVQLQPQIEVSKLAPSTPLIKIEPSIDSADTSQERQSADTLNVPDQNVEQNKSDSPEVNNFKSTKAIAKKTTSKKKPIKIVPQETETLTAETVAVPLVVDSSEMKRPVGLFAPRDDKPDDLKLIKGIGPTNERKLNQIGIYHYDQIANWTLGEAEWINSFLEFPGRVDREDWIKQAKELIG